MSNASHREWKLRTNVDLSLELLVGLDGAGSSHYHSPADLVTLDTTDESTHVVTSFTTVQFLVEHLYIRVECLQSSGNRVTYQCR